MTPPKSTETLKFTEWRPIGVCDNGPPNLQKAQIFRQADLEIVNARGITRDNWMNHPKVVNVVNRYAQKVAKISTMTKQMKKPTVAHIKLVGLVLDYHHTPSLNQESVSGKVQLFQIEFRDKPSKKIGKWWLYFLTLSLLMLIAGIGAALFITTTTYSPLPAKKISMCGSDRYASAYSADIEKNQQSLNHFLTQLPGLFKLNQAHQICLSAPVPSVEAQEYQFLGCYFALEEASVFIRPQSSLPLEQIHQCLENICDKKLPHLKKYCRRL